MGPDVADRRVLARLCITPCGLYEPITQTVSLAEIGSNYFLVSVERNGLTNKQSRRRVKVSRTVVQEQVAALKQATVPAFPVSPLVCDGEHVELTIHGEYSALTLGWWTIAPQGAERFSEFADWLRKEGLANDEEHDGEKD